MVPELSPTRDVDWDSEILRSLPVAIAVLEPGGRIVKMNRHAEEFTSCAEDDAIGKRWSDLFELPDAVATPFTNAVEAGARFAAEAVRIVVPQRNERYYACIEAAPLRNRAAVCVFIRDITAWWKRETRYLSARHLDSMQHMASGLAQTLNNLIATIQGCTEEVTARLSRAGIGADTLRRLHEGTRRAAAVAQQLQAFSRKATSDPKLIDLSSIVNGMQSVMAGLLGPAIELRVQAEHPVAAVEADRVHVQQILVSLTQYAKRQIPGTGKIIVRTYNETIPDHVAMNYADVQPGDYVAVELAYDRPPTQAEESGAVLEPFVHAPDSSSTGVELPAAYGLIKQAGGHMILGGEPDATRWTLYWPVAFNAESYWPAAGEQANGESVLVVESQPDTRMASGEALLYRGYRVLEASNGIEALRVLKQQHDPVNVVVTDLFMPTMSGVELAAEVRRISPQTNVVFMSSYDPQVLTGHGLPQDAKFIRKPCAPDMLARTVRSVLTSSS